ncbi:hypothetical protein [Aliiglaciecola lipolytica]|uniref:O-antigen polymerase n=1 Tax=Aliiglaciecola lipolytica E3 TaxID=1127673 RepID=K6YZ11_9ALTE|nr:hypothetical protein [Aliiglaciecola lipolytica]GAC16445.1 hypothetical protein GLIP_3834 [Aliiglaciecola lipolytica E3]
MILFNYLFAGIISSQKITFFGEIYIGELICGLVVLLNLKNIKLSSFTKQIIILLFIWFFVQIFSDIINNTDLLKSLKGILIPVFVLVIYLGLDTYFRDKAKYLFPYLIGVFIGFALTRFIIGSEEFQSNPWKWGVGSCVALCFFMFLDFKIIKNKQFYLLIGALFLISLCFANSSRALAGFIFIPTLICLFTFNFCNLNKLNMVNKSVTFQLSFYLFILFSIVIFDRILYLLFTFEPFLDLLPIEDAFKYSIQAQSQWGVILGGRTELLISLKAFFDAPLFGHGSWAENSFYKFAHLKLIDDSGGALMDLRTAELNTKTLLIPTHSYLMGAIVWGGFFAGLFWLRILGLLISGFLKPDILNSPLKLFISVSLIWNILFSPFGADARWLSTVLLWLYVFKHVKTGIQKGIKNEDFNRHNIV